MSSHKVSFLNVIVFRYLRRATTTACSSWPSRFVLVLAWFGLLDSYTWTIGDTILNKTFYIYKTMNHLPRDQSNSTPGGGLPVIQYWLEKTLSPD